MMTMQEVMRGLAACGLFLCGGFFWALGARMAEWFCGRKKS